MSRGIYVAATVEDAAGFVRRQKVPYLVQEMLAPIEEWRYVLHRTGADLLAGRGPSIRVAYEKLGPHVTGDGISRWVQLGKKLAWRDAGTGPFLRYRRLPNQAHLAKVDD